MHKPPTFIDLFAGCGGLSLGFLNAGWKGIFAIEKNADAFITLKHNLIESQNYNYEWPNWLPKSNHDINDFLVTYASQLKSLKGKIDLIAGGPPCQGFSPAGKRDPNDPRNRLAEKYIEVVSIIKPKLLLIENVKGFNSSFLKSDKHANNLPYSHHVKSRLESLGYSVEFQILKSSDFGVPQLRPRFILIATLLEADLAQDNFELLLASRQIFLKKKGLPSKRSISVREAIADLEIEGQDLTDSTDSPISGYKQLNYLSNSAATSSFIRLMRKDCSKGYIPNSMRLPKHTPAIKTRFSKILSECRKGYSLSTEDRKRYGTRKHSLTPLDSSKPSATITTLPDDILHYSEPRILTVREIARIQSFPDWFSFLGPYTTGGKKRKTDCPRYTQVGNAVPPLLAEAIATYLLHCVKGKIECKIMKTS
ncbi:DNA cytosine methyltransferase [Vreelandella neptunia]|uniref:DNA cytosine methyltransferase n=1 Tax=Vreelandella neptunia TaxID=115551 RepID=UPI00315A6724